MAIETGLSVKPGPPQIVNDLKRAGKRGPIALWMEQSTDAYFRNLRISEAQ